MMFANIMTLNIMHTMYELLEVTVQFYMGKINGLVHSKRHKKYMYI